MFYTYQWLRPDATPYYVGKGSGFRAFTNVGHTVRRPKDRARIFIQHWESEEKAFEMEIWYIAFFGRKDLGTGILRNRTNGGDGTSGVIGRKHTEESKQYLSRIMTGRVFSEETKRRMSEAKSNMSNETRHKMGLARVGHKHSEETRRKLSISATRRMQSEESRNQIRLALTGRKLPEEHRHNIALAGMGRTPSEETRIKISLSNKARWGEVEKEQARLFRHSEETLTKMRLSQKVRRDREKIEANHVC